MDRSVATAAGTGSLSGVLLSALAQSLASPAPFDPCPICLDLPGPALDSWSLILGILIGICLGPAVDILYGARLVWRRTTLRWWGSISGQTLVWYKVHE